MQKITAVVLAGGRKEELQESYGTDYWALVQVEGKLMVSYIIDALRGSGIDEIVIVGEWTKDAGLFQDCHLIEGSVSHIGNVESGLRAATNPTILLCMCDLPAITSKSISDFIEACEKRDLAVGYPIAEIEECQRRFPGMNRTTVILKEGRFTGGNIFWLNRDLILKKMELIHKLIAMRKKPIQLVKIFGLSFTLSFVLAMLGFSRFLTIVKLEQRAGEILGVNVGAVCADPEIASDVDTPAHLEAFLSSLDQK